MSKRFTETNIWNEDWFLDLPKNYKLLYFYVKDNCDHAGIWRPNVRLFEAMIEDKVDLNKALIFFNNGKTRIEILDCGRWFILDFFVFQYGTTFNPLNRVHKSIQSIYSQMNIDLTSIRGLIDLKEGVKDKDKDKDKGKDISKSTEEKKELLRVKALKFKEDVFKFTTYPNEMLSQFWKYWIEPNKSFTKLKYELEETWDTNLRLQRWANNNKSKPLGHLVQAAKHDSDFNN